MKIPDYATCAAIFFTLGALITTVVYTLGLRQYYQKQWESELERWKKQHAHHLTRR